MGEFQTARDPSGEVPGKSGGNYTVGEGSYKNSHRERLEPWHAERSPHQWPKHSREGGEHGKSGKQGCGGSQRVHLLTSF